LSESSHVFVSGGLTRPVHTASGERRWISALSWEDFSWWGLPQVCLVLQILLFGTSLVLYRVTDIDVRWSTDLGFLAFIGMLVALWIALIALAGRRVLLRRFAEALAATILFLSLIQITAPMQYGALALGRPFVDAWLDRADHWLGIDVAHLTAWTAQYPRLVSTLNMSYDSLAPQLLLPLIVLPLSGDRRALWEYLWHLHVSLFGAIICLALWPTVYVFTYRHFDPLVSPAMVEHCMNQLWNFHAGRSHTLTSQDMQGLISFPSFHTAAAVAVTWALRRQRRWIWMPIALLNVGLVSATVLLGLHYATDLIGTAVLLAASLVVYRRWFAAPVAATGLP
jgi:membrane-associated phospholipid phosphatase